MKKLSLLLCAVLISLGAMANDVIISQYAVTYSETDGDYMHRLYSADGMYLFEFDIFRQVEPDQTYTLANDMIDEYTMCTYYGTRKQYRITEASFVYSIVEGKKHVEADVTCSLGSYHLVYQENTDVISTDTVLMYANNITLMDWAQSMGQVVLSASNDTYAIDLWINTHNVLGSYTERDLITNYCLILNKQTSAQMGIKKANFSIAMDGIDYVVRGFIHATDGHCYQIVLGYEVPDPTRYGTITIENGILYDATKRQNYLQVNGENDDYHVALVFVTSVLENAEFKRADLYSNYSGVTEYLTDKGMEVLDADVQLTIVDEDHATMTGRVLARDKEDHSDIVEFTVSIQCEIDHSGEGLDGDSQDEDFIKHYETNVLFVVPFYYEEYGYVYLEVENPADNSFVTLCLVLPRGLNLEDGIPERVYEISDTQNPFTALASIGIVGGSAFPSYAGYYDPDSGEPVEPMWFITEGKVTISSNGDEPYVLVEGTNSFGREVRIEVGSLAEGIEAVEQDRPTSTKRIIDGQLIIEHNGIQYSVLGFQK